MDDHIFLYETKMASGTIERWYWNPKDDSYTVEHELPTPDLHLILDAVKAKRNAGDGFDKSRDTVHYASIPPQMFRVWGQQYGLADGWERTEEGMAFLLRIMDNPDFKKFRVNEGRIGRVDHKEL